MIYDMVPNLKSKKKHDNFGRINCGNTITCERSYFKVIHTFNSYFAGAKINYQYSA